jgi:hypothetical protein
MSKKQEPVGKKQHIGTHEEKERKVDARCQRCQQQPALLPDAYCAPCAEIVAQVDAMWEAYYGQE